MAAARAPTTRARRSGSARPPIAASPTASSTSASSMPVASASNRTSPSPTNGSASRQPRAMRMPAASATISPSASTFSRWRRRGLRSRPSRRRRQRRLARRRLGFSPRAGHRQARNQAGCNQAHCRRSLRPRDASVGSVCRIAALSSARNPYNAAGPIPYGSASGEDRLSTEDSQDEKRIRRSPTGPAVTAPRIPAGQPSVPQPPRQKRHFWSIVIFVLLASGILIRAYRDLSQPDAWDYWKDQYVSPSLTSQVINTLDLDGSNKG